MMSPRVVAANKNQEETNAIIVGSEVIGSPESKQKSSSSKRKIVSKSIIKMPPGTLDNRLKKKKSKFNIDLKGLGKSSMKR